MVRASTNPRPRVDPRRRGRDSPRRANDVLREAQNLIDSYTNQGMRSTDDLERRIVKHLKPFFKDNRLISIDAPATRRYTTARLKEGAAPSTVNRELAVLNQVFTVAIKDRKVATRPAITMLSEAGRKRTGFFEPEQYDAVVAKLPEELRAAVTFTNITGWRIADEVFPLTWDRVDFAAGEVRLHDSKNKDGRVFPMTADLRRLLEAQAVKRDALKKAGTICPLVFFRMIAKDRRGPKSPRQIKSMSKAWRLACREAGVPGRIPHDFRRTAIRRLERAGVPRSVAMKMVGHKTESVYKRYDIVSPADLKHAAEKLDAFVNLPTKSERSSRKGGRR